MNKSTTILIVNFPVNGALTHSEINMKVYES